MVLSNKKLKQKLRATLTESLTATVSEEAGNKSVSSSNKSFKELLGSVTPKPRLSKREKRRKISSLQPSNSIQLSNGNGNTQIEEEKKKEGIISSEKKKKKNKKKRKIEDIEGKESENGGGLEVKEDKSAKKKPNKKKAKKKKNNKKRVEIGNANVIKNEEPAEVVTERQESVDANADADAVAVAATKVYVGGIPYYSSEDDIRSFFESCGTITEMDCMTFPETGKFRGIAMITFKTEAAAKRALALDGADMGGLFLKIQPYKVTRTPKLPDFAPQLIEGYNRVYVGNLSWDITEDDLRKLFTDCKISAIRLGEDKTTGEFRGYAHVDFTDNLSLTIALKLDQTEVCGRPVRITCAVPKKKLENNISGFRTEKTEKDENGGLSSGGEKKRRTCYECGVPGHISFACPKKKAENNNSGSKTEEPEEAENGIPSGKKRRTCYECGVPGHISSNCPKKKAENNNSISKTEEPEEAENGISSSGGGKKRRTCYECGVPGHISSACPTKKAANNNSDSKTEEPEKTENSIPSSGGAKKRRTCYECGVPGHISSDCPKKQGVEPVIAS
ncbi:hypothetical protein AQUCO_01000690v1 [Aquilegia coerulea]|uniref:Phragmoplastin interacting protein 1 n=1 Tax=Aquilegia coerulea TaxID=218851 RepID=A0A2G5EBA6_AQUCA|nr:hypothetical protein AQUCO_01000690v1 [Aquilegia coerulea]